MIVLDTNVVSEMQLQPLWDPTFSEHSYGFRPGRSSGAQTAPQKLHQVAPDPTRILFRSRLGAEGGTGLLAQA
jgi:hypothetical protein